MQNDIEALKTEVSRLRAALKDLSRAYVSMMETGRDRIIALGGDCDPVDVMERGDPYLHKAREALSGDSSAPETQKPSNDETLVCDDCRQPTTWEHAVQADLWGRATGDVLCENCAESRWQRHQERLMETT